MKTYTYHNNHDIIHAINTPMIAMAGMNKETPLDYPWMYALALLLVQPFFLCLFVWVAMLIIGDS